MAMPVLKKVIIMEQLTQRDAKLFRADTVMSLSSLVMGMLRFSIFGAGTMAM